MKTVDLPRITGDSAESEPPADRLQFPPTRSYPKNKAVVAATYDGFHVQFELTDIGIGRVEEFVCQLVERGYTPAPVAAPAPVHTQNGNGHAPHFAADGTPSCLNANCSRHGKPMEPSQRGGWYCKGKDARTGNAKGYCKETA